MINVLQNWTEIGQSAIELGRRDLPRHDCAEKCWDLYHLTGLIENLPLDARIVDLGCGGVFTLRFLHAMGFTALTGVDLTINVFDRARQFIRMWRGKTLKRPFRLYKQDLTHTKFASGTIDVATCISVLEHGVDSDKFFKEASRILKPSGLLYITVDYWEDKIDVSEDVREFGLPWQIFSKKDIEQLLTSARSHGLKLHTETTIPKCQDKCVVWHKKEYTSILLAFVKAN
ncbi:MAG: class I SAM-dependent methyltransferase [Phycisphaerae bacterium]|nr:class I SAM-dependent methyltransferase [Phycisphaerae bacterium]